MKIESNAEQERAEIKNAYSYTRLSSKKQLGTGKTGQERQLAKPEQICQENGWQLSKQSFADLGVSAFSGDNFNGNLGQFISLAKQGKLLPNAVLLIEAFDRFSRLDIDKSEPKIIDLLNLGIAIHVAFVNKTFTKQSTTSIGDRIEIMLSLKSAFEYSANLSKRVSAAKQIKFAKIQNGESCNLGDVCPTWINWDNDTKTHILNNHADTIKRIFKEYLNGHSLGSIAKSLNNEKIPALQSKQWNRVTIRYILSSITTVGLFKGKSIFPAIVTQDMFDKTQVMLERNKSRKGRRTELVNLFRSLIFCSECGNSVSFRKQSNRNFTYYRCQSKGDGKCTVNRSFRADKVENEFFASAIGNNPKDILNDKDNNNQDRIDTLKATIQLLEKKMDTLLDMAQDSRIKDKYAQFALESSKAKSELASLTNAATTANDAPKAILELVQALNFSSAFSPELLKELGKSFSFQPQFAIAKVATTTGKAIDNDLANKEIRQKVQVILPSLVTRIDLDFANQKFHVEFTTGKHFQS